MTILYKFASRSRPEKFFNAVENIYINSRLTDYSILATLDTDDLTMNNPDVIDRMKRYDKLYPIFGESKNKIHAVNRDMDKAPDFDLLINMSDDMVFIEPGFDEIIVNDINENFPDWDCLMHYSDGNQRDRVITMPIMTKKYYDRFGYIYHPSYVSLWCDNEQMDVAIMLGKYKYMGDEKVIFRHYHPAWGQSEMDDLYRRNESPSFWNRDERNYRTRKANNFDPCY